jgi:hypothetical protein
MFRVDPFPRPLFGVTWVEEDNAHTPAKRGISVSDRVLIVLVFIAVSPNWVSESAGRTLLPDAPILRHRPPNASPWAKFFSKIIFCKFWDFSLALIGPARKMPQRVRSGRRAWAGPINNSQKIYRNKTPAPGTSKGRERIEACVNLVLYIGNALDFPIPALATIGTLVALRRRGTFGSDRVGRNDIDRRIVIPFRSAIQATDHRKGNANDKVTLKRESVALPFPNQRVLASRKPMLHVRRKVRDGINRGQVIHSLHVPRIMPSEVVHASLPNGCDHCSRPHNRIRLHREVPTFHCRFDVREHIPSLQRVA